MKASNRLSNLPAYYFASLGQRIAALRAQGMDVIRLDIGSPDMPPPNFVIEELYRSAQDPSHHGYAGYYGLPALRQAIADYYQRRFGVTLDPDREVVPLIGSKEGIVNIALAFVDPGDVVLVPDPGYPTYTRGTILAGGDIFYFPLLEENDFLPDLEAIPPQVAERAKLLWLNYPNNPTGAVAPLEFFERAVHFARRYNLLVCHDAPYCDVTYDGYVAPSMLQIPEAKEVVLEFNSLSKSFNMAGWRVGMAVGNPVAVEALARTKTNIDSGIFRPIQDAAIAALSGDYSWLAERNAVYQERRDMIYDTLVDMGLEVRKPQASLYLWPKVPPGYTSEEFAGRLLEEKGVSITPGSAFGSHGEGYLRISVGMSTERIREALRRMREFAF